MDKALQPVQALFQATFKDALGSVLIATFISSMLFGLTAHQTYRYFRFYQHRDRTWLKCFVTVLWVLDIMHAIGSIHASYSYAILCHTNLLGIDIMGWSPGLTNIITSVVEVATNGFYIWRLYTLRKKNMPLIIFLVILSVIQFGMMFSVTLKAITMTRFSNLHEITWFLILAFAMTAVFDIVVTGSLVWCLRKSRTGVERTDSVVNTLVWYTVQTGALTSTSGVICMVLAATTSRNLIYMGAVIIHPKLYTNSILAVLNSREYVRKKGMKSFELDTLNQVHEICIADVMKR